MPKITVLPPHVADLIAAGEVVERPGSVIKELMENSIDAGALSLTVEIRSGGMAYIRCTDDGCGIAPEDAQTAFLRHATSKLRDERGLEAIGTLGFRGEALAAISAVSHIELLTRERGAAIGTRVTVSGGEITGRNEAGCPEGTTLIVRDLFFNTPARLKFMKTDRAEGAAVTAAVLRCALSHPEVSVRYIKDGKEEFHTPGDGRSESCIYTLLGRDFASEMLEVTSSDGEVEVGGYVSSPVNAHGNRNAQFFFLNGRFIRSKTLQAALEQAYRNSLLVGRFPACVLYVEMSPAAVDVNVHPAKTEVKFLREKQVFDAVYYAALSALGGETKRAQIVLSPGTKAALGGAEKTDPHVEAGIPDTGIPAMERPDRLRAKEDSVLAGPVQPKAAVKPTGDFFKTVPADTFRGSFGSGGFRTAVPPTKQSARDFEPVRNETRTPYQTKMDLPLSREGAAPQSTARQDTEEPSGREDMPELGKSEFRVIGETMGTYILVEKEGRLVLIDKHAAHERILFDRLKSRQGETMSQLLLTPVICDVGVTEAACLTENAPLLEKYGLEVGAFGESSVAVHQVPTGIETGDIRPLLDEIVTKLSAGGDPEDRRDGVLHSIACKAAIKAGNSSPRAELEKLAEQVLSGGVKYCPHGRPVAVELTKAALDKSFRRT